jgi:hypothetical protein
MKRRRSIKDRGENEETDIGLKFLPKSFLYSLIIPLASVENMPGKIKSLS